MRASVLGAVALATGAWLWAAPLRAQQHAPALQPVAPEQPLRAQPRGWQARFEREQPAILRAIEGVPGPPGYERETRYDRRRMLMGSLALGLGTGMQLLVVSSRGFEGAELVPCVGVFAGDYGQSTSDSGWVDTERIARAFLSVPICALFLGGTIELGRGLLDPRPVWVRREAKSGSLRLAGVVTDREARIHAIGYF